MRFEVAREISRDIANVLVKRIPEQFDERDVKKPDILIGVGDDDRAYCVVTVECDDEWVQFRIGNYGLGFVDGWKAAKGSG